MRRVLARHAPGLRMEGGSGRRPSVKKCVRSLHRGGSEHRGLAKHASGLRMKAEACAGPSAAGLACTRDLHVDPASLRSALTGDSIPFSLLRGHIGSLKHA
jgi:hypothetical protein